ncbi:MAG: heavy metal translocating P-type ATPase [Verrucomicrobiota bacterium]|nr:heavy metal translocating P-type ATPase [Verrucomicrobiota bacterium]
MRHWLLPGLVLCGLLAGLVARFVFGLAEFGEWIWFGVLVGGGLPIVWQTVMGMVRGKFASDIVAMLAIVTAVLLGQAFAGAVVVLMQSGGEAIEAYGLQRARSSLTALLQRAPRRARRKIDGRMEEVDVEAVRVGDVLIVRPGDLVPVDGTVVSGRAEVDESALTGEALARVKEVGDRLLSGSVGVSGAFEMRADRVSGESQYAKIVTLVQRAQEEKAPIQRLADRYAVWFTPLTLVMGALGYWITGDPTTVLSVLVVATPCPLILATPLAVMCGINRAADEGIIVKGGAPMEQVAGAQAVLFDKTGTITYGMPFVEKVVAFEERAEEELLTAGASVEQLSSHSVAKAVVDRARQEGKSLVLPEDFQEVPGRGVAGRVGERSYLLGSAPFVEERMGKECLAPHRELLSQYFDKMIIFVVRNGACIGCFVLSDRIRPGVSRMIEELGSMGVQKVVLLTGDRRRNAEIVAREAGISSYEAELLPEQKVDLVRQYERKYGSVIMVGDGINDAPALATATVGIAMGAHGTAISVEAADVILLVDEVAKVAETMKIGQRMLRIAKQSIFAGMGLSFLLMIFAASGHVLPAVGAMLQEIIDVVVILNALRAR